MSDPADLRGPLTAKPPSKSSGAEYPRHPFSPTLISASVLSSTQTPVTLALGQFCHKLVTMQVIAYGSRLLSKAERRNCVTRRELLAVVTFTKQYRPYLMGRRFLLRTDHGSLTWLQNFREPEGQLARWLERLQELDFEIVHRRGRKHSSADALSRLPCRQCGRGSHDQSGFEVIAATAVQPSQEYCVEGLREAQLADPTLGVLLRGKEEGRKPSAEELGCASRSTRRLLQIWDQLRVHDGVLCRLFATPDGTGASSTAQLVVDNRSRWM